MVDIDVLAVRLARGQHRIVSRAQLLARRATRDQIDHAVRRGILVPLHPGVYLVGGGSPGFETLMMAATLATRGYASHRAGAALFGLRRVPMGRLAISVEQQRVPKLEGVQVHKIRGLLGCDRTRIGSIPVLHPAVILLQLAGNDPELVEGALDDALVRRITTLGTINGVLERLGGKGRRGSGLLRDLVEARRAGQRPTESALEDDFVALARDFRLTIPTRQLPLGLDGGPDARCDFGDADRCLDFEIDGSRYHAGYSDKARDRSRDGRVQDKGWLVRRFTTADIRERPNDVAAIVRALQLRDTGPRD